MLVVAEAVQVAPAVLAAVEQVDFLMEQLQRPVPQTLVAVAVAEREQAVRMRSWALLVDPELSSFVTQLHRQFPLHQQLVGAPLMGRR
jgi:phosphoribosylformimino-5-aminoimidazole carboxamide ribonucleotide (ProFAR) isomerase